MKADSPDREASLVTPDRYREHLVDSGVPPGDLETAPVVVAAWGPTCRALASAMGARRRRGWPFNLEWPYFDRAGTLGVVPLPTGAPAATLLLEMLACCGTSRFIGVGVACSLDPNLPPGSVVIATRALGGDGTSASYQAPSPLVPDRGLASGVADALISGDVSPGDGVVWTTDAPFRETPAVVAAARQDGARLIDMETAAIYAFASRRGAAACSILVVSDLLAEEWHPAFGAPEVQRGIGALVEALAATL